MAEKRKLTLDQIEKIRKYVEQRERSNYPDQTITVSVKTETDDDGNPIVNITRMKESVVEGIDLEFLPNAKVR